MRFNQHRKVEVIWRGAGVEGGGGQVSVAPEPGARVARKSTKLSGGVPGYRGGGQVGMAPEPGARVARKSTKSSGGGAGVGGGVQVVLKSEGRGGRGGGGCTRAFCSFPLLS